jgi:hypothetical protein
MRRIILSRVTCLAVPHFFTLSHKRLDFRKKLTEHKMYILVFCTNLAWNISHSKNLERNITDVLRSSFFILLILPVRF